MKRALLFLITLCLVLNSFAISAFAAPADVEFSMGEVKAMIAELGQKLNMASPEDRARGFLLARTYISTDDGIDTLIEIVENDEFATNPVVGDMYTVLGDISARKDQFVFVLKFFKCFEPEDRIEVMDKFYARDTEIFSASAKRDIATIFEYFNEEEEINSIEEGNAVTGEMIASLFAIFDGEIMLTDASYGSSDFKLKSMSNGFKNKLNDLLDEYSIGGKTYTAKSFVEMLLKDANRQYSSGIKTKIKNVFKNLGIYVPASDDTTSNSGTNGNGTTTVLPTPQYGTMTPGKILSSSELLAQHQAVGNKIEGFDDTAGHWSYNDTTFLKHIGILAGDAGTNNYRPDWKINREEMAVLMLRVLEIRDGVDASSVSHIRFEDEGDISPWAVNAIAYLEPLGILKGYPDGNYMPKKEISREEAVAIISRVLDKKYAPTKAVTEFEDHHHIGEWAEEDVVYTASLNIVKGYTTGEFLPKNNITRAEVATLIFNMLCVEGLLK